MTRRLLCASAVFLALPTVAQVAPDADVPTESPEVRAALAADAEAARQRAARLRPPAWYVDARAGARTAGARATITVNTLAGDNDGTCGTDGGDPIDDCSLLEAIDLANSDPDPDVVVFSVTGIIDVDQEPVITTPVTVDGTAGGNEAGEVVIDGPSGASMAALRITGSSASGSIVRGLSMTSSHYGLRIVGGANGVGAHQNYITEAQYGIQVSEGASNATIFGNNITGGGDYIFEFGIQIIDSNSNTIGGPGLDQGNIITDIENAIRIIRGGELGNIVQGNTMTGSGPDSEIGITLINAFGVVGGTAEGEGNVISGFKTGISVGTTGMSVIGNRITGNPALIDTGIRVGGSGNAIGGTAPGAGNQISDCRYGVLLDFVSLGEANVVTGNTILGDGNPATEDFGVYFDGGSDGTGPTIGTPGAGNMISRFSYGVYLFESTGAIVRGNTVEGDGDPATEDYGVYIRRRSIDNIVGGTAPGEGNVISGVAYGVAVTRGSDQRNAILGTTIANIDELGIDLGDDGVTPNDPGDDDGGPNLRQNFPIVTVAAAGDGVGFTLDSTPNTAFRIEAFANDQPGPTGYGDGERFLGAVEVTTDGSGQAEGFVPALGLDAGEWVTTTATPIDAASPTGFGGTSEFSLAVEALGAPPPPQPGPVYTVNTLASDTDGFCGDGADPLTDCSLLDALSASNAAPGPNVIQFSVTGTIEVLSTATVTTPVTIDGTANGRSAGDVVIDGSNGIGSASLLITGESASGSVVRGLAIISSNVGLRIDEGAAGVGVYGNYLGTTPTGGDLGNGIGILVRNASDATIGGASAEDGNVLSWNGIGVSVRGVNATGTTILGNAISGDTSSNDDVGIFVDLARGTVIGGSSPGAGNVLAGLNLGIEIINGATETSVQGNRLSGRNGIRLSDAPGTTIGGTSPNGGNRVDATATSINILGASNGVNVWGNTIDGGSIYVGSDGTLLGGSSQGEGNVLTNSTVSIASDDNVVLGNRITGSGEPDGGYALRVTGSGNQIGRPDAGNEITGHRYGIGIDGSGSRVADGNSIQANTITDTSRGIWIVSASGTSVGGAGAGEGNTIANNDVGLVIDGSTATDNAALGNAISGSDGLGFDLGADGVTPNDAGDGDDGPNGYQNFPVLAEATAADGVGFTLDSTPNTTFRVEAFANAEPDPTGFGEGARYLGFAEVTTDASGRASGAVPAPGLAVGEWATATATPVVGPDAFGGTSEFSRAVEATAADDTDVPVSFAVAELSASETEGAVGLEIRVGGPLDTPATVTVSLVAGNPADLGGFTSTTIDVVAASGERRYPLSVPITDDVLAEGDETFVFELSVSGESPLVVAAPSRAEVTVIDNDDGGGGGGGGGNAVTVTVPTAAGPFLFASPVDGLPYGSLAAGGQTRVFTYDAGTNGFVEVGPGFTFDRGEPVLIAGAGGDLALTGAPGPEVLSVAADAESGGPVLALVGNPTGVPIPFDAIAVDGGALTDVALVFDAEAGAFRPVSLAGLAADLVLGPFDVVVLQVTPDGDDDVSVTLDTDAPYTVGTSLADAPFVPLDDEAAVVLALSSAGAGIADTAVLRFGVGALGLDPFDGLDVESPVGPTLAAFGPAWGDDGSGSPGGVYAALSGWDLESGPVTVPLAVSAPAAGTYDLSLGAEPGAIGTRPILIEVLDGASAAPLELGAPYAFQVGSGEDLSGRFAVRLSLGGGVATGQDPTAFSVTTYPNPVRNAAHVALTVPEAGPLSVLMFDALGREVGRIERAVGAGSTQVTLPVAGLSPGVYVVRVDGPGGVATRRLTVAR